jgi:hypothetical protein
LVAKLLLAIIARDQDMSYDNEKSRVTVSEEESISAKAKETGQILKELVASIGRKTRAAAEEKTGQLKEAADDKDIAARDAMDIQMLGSHIDSILSIFDSTMDRIAQQPYEDQQDLMVGFKKVLKEEIYVINARLNMARRLKGLEHSVDLDANQRVEERLVMNRPESEVVAEPMLEAEDAETIADFSEQK